MGLLSRLLTNPQEAVRKLKRIGGWLFVVGAVLWVVKNQRDKMEKVRKEQEERQQMLAETQKMKAEVNWEANLKTIVPDQEELLTPNVVPQLLMPPLLNKIDVPQALVFERQKRYSAAFEYRATPAIRLWSVPASAAGVDVSAPVSVDLPAITPPLSKEQGQPRQPKPPRGVGPSYILLP